MRYTMKKQHIIFGIFAVVILTIVAVGVFLLTRPTIREWTGEDAARNSTTTRGMFAMTQHENNTVISFADFTTGRESVFCSRPQCRHNSRDCFAFDLVNTYHANHFAIMGEHIYFTSASYDPTRENRHVIDIYEASFTGGMVRSIARVENRESFDIWNSWMQDGYFILDFRLSNFSNVTQTKGFFAIIDLRTGELWNTPEKVGYNSGIDFITINNGVMFYCHFYTVRPITNAESQQIHEEKGMWGQLHHFQQYRRHTVYVADFNTRTERTWSEAFTEYIGFYSESIVEHRFCVLPNGILVNSTTTKLNTVTSDSPFRTYSTLALHDFETGEVIREFDDDWGAALMWTWESYMYLIFDDLSPSHAIYCLATNTMSWIEGIGIVTDTNMFTHFTDFTSRTGEVIILITSENGERVTSVTSFENLFNYGLKNLRVLRLLPDRMSLIG